MPNPTVAPYGSWTSPIRVENIVADSVNLAYPRLVGDEVWWLEGRPSEGGRYVVVARAADGTTRDVLPAGWSARARVHEYGGRPYTPYEASDATFGVVFTSWADQRLYRLGPDDAEPVALTPEPAEPAGLRYADLQTVQLDGATVVIAVREAHVAGEVQRAIVAVPVHPRDDAAGDGVRVLADNRHFLANPRLSPDGRRLAWIGWDHPNMPWDGTELFVADLGSGDSPGATGGSEPLAVLGGQAESVTQIEWANDDGLYATSDRSGWWNLYEVPAAGGDPKPLAAREEEFGCALWVLGLTTFAVLDDGRILTEHGVGEMRLGILDPASGELTDLDGPYTDWAEYLDAAGTRAVGIAESAVAAPAVVLIDLADSTMQRLREATSDLPDEAYLPLPRRDRFDGMGGRPVYANVYPPRNPDFVAPDGELPPYVVFVHGGPTSLVTATLNLGAAILTSRGIGVIDVNYGGSVGFGREYRQSLVRQWGVIDVEDVVSAAEGLAVRGEADRERLAIRGGSAGGWTTLCALTRTTTFACGNSLFGVADLEALVADTHDFESRYVEKLVGDLPQDRDVFVERSPLTHADSLRVPVLLQQGLEDKVVPPAQAEVFVAALERAGVPYAYLPFEGEQHGFRIAANIVTSINAELSFYGQVFGFEPPDVPKLELTYPAKS